MNKNRTTYHARGKLILSGEYLVLHGAKALALPLQLGQNLTVTEGSDSGILHWKALHKGEIWFECELSPADFTVIKSSDPEKASTLSLVFRTIREMNPEFHPQAGTNMETTLDADPAWGFGSSSTLISLLSQWAGVDPFKLNETLFGGSGFDIACATAAGPILYTIGRPAHPVKLAYPFAKQLLFIYSGKKKKTLPEVSAFLQNTLPQEFLIKKISAISDQFALCQDQSTFDKLIQEHEALVGELLDQQPVKEKLFDDFKGQVKSLGAWGGDYYLASCTESVGESKKYFENKGLSVIFSWTELIKT